MKVTLRASVPLDAREGGDVVEVAVENELHHTKGDDMRKTMDMFQAAMNAVQAGDVKIPQPSLDPDFPFKGMRT